MLIIAVVVGVVLGAAWGDGFGAAAGALLAWLLVRSHRHGQQIGALQQALKLLQAHGNAVPIEAPAAADNPEPRAAAGSATATATATPATPTKAPQPDAAAESLWDTQPGTVWEPPGQAIAAPPARPGPFSAIKSWLLGGNTIVKAGVGILFIGLAFLAKFASEHVQVPVELRLAGIAGVALVLLGLGWRLRVRRPGYAQVLQGGAVAVLYLTLFVAFRFYGVLAVGPVFGLMVLVAALAAALAVLQDARALAVIGALGGFATPLLVSSGSGDQVALFAYYLVLDLGIAAVAWHKTWRALNLIGFVATFIVATAWGVMRYQPEHYLSSQGFLIAFFLLFNAILLMPARRLAGGAAEGAAEGDAGRPQRADGWVNGGLLFGLPTITFALQHGLVRHTDFGTALAALVLAAFYVLLATLMRSRTRLAVTFDASLAIGVVFLTLVIPFALDARSTAGAWALEGAGLVWLGFRQARGLPRGFGYALLALAGLAMRVAHDRYGAPTALFNATLFNALMAAAASLAAAYFVRRSGLSAATSPSGWARAEVLAEPLLIAAGLLWAGVAAGVQIDAFVSRPFTLAAWLAAVSAIALVCAGLSTRLDWPQVAWPTLAHAPLLAVGVLASAIELRSPVAGGGGWAWPVALATHAVVLWRAAPHWPPMLQRAVHTLGVLVLAGLGALQGRAITQGWGDARSAWAWLGWLLVPALLLLWLPRPAAARRWPVSAAPAAYQSVAAGLLTLGLLLWTLLANAASNGSARPLPYLPLLNPLDLGVAVALLAAWGWLRGDAAHDATGARRHLPAVALGITGFVWLNAMLIRAFHHFGGVPFRVDAWAHSLAVQTGITLLWAVTALVLMWLSARRALRLPWMVGAALLAAVVLKLLLVDQSGTGTVTRIVSFIGVGVLMLVIGYVAPLPSKAAPEGARHASA